MLVYLKEPMGYTQLDGYRVYGRKYAYGSFGSTDLPVATYKKYKEILEDAPYTQGWLESKFNKSFDGYCFRIRDLYSMSFEDMIKLARLVGINYVERGRHEPTVKERNALRKSIVAFLNS